MRVWFDQFERLTAIPQRVVGVGGKQPGQVVGGKDPSGAQTQRFPVVSDSLTALLGPLENVG